MKQKIKCKKCGLLIDDDLEYCPYCGEKQKEGNIENKEPANIIEEKPLTKQSIKFMQFPQRHLNISTDKSAALFLVGLLLVNAFGYVLGLFLSLSGNLNFLYYQSGINYSAAVNFSIYFFLFAIQAFIIGKDINQIFEVFKKPNTYFVGFAFGFIATIASSTISAFFNLFNPLNSSNANQQAVQSIVDIYPLLSLLVFGLIGPICEELTYRAGLFNLLKKKNRYLAYILTAVIFGLIHFDFGSFAESGYQLLSEVLNLPSYIVSGLIFCYIYEYQGIGASIIAHASNNLISVLLTILL